MRTVILICVITCGNESWFGIEDEWYIVQDIEHLLSNSAITKLHYGIVCDKEYPNCHNLNIIGLGLDKHSPEEARKIWMSIRNKIKFCPRPKEIQHDECKFDNANPELGF